MSDSRRQHNDRADGRPVAELLSAYLDDRESLSSSEIEHVEALLAGDDAARQIYAELQTITQELASLPEVEAPRSYHLDAEMIGAPEPILLQESGAWYARHAATVRWATAAAAVLFVFVLGADLVINGVVSNPGGGDDAIELQQGEQLSRDADEATGDNADALEEDVEEAAENDAESAAALAPQVEADDSGGDEDAAADGAEAEEAEEEAAGDEEPVASPEINSEEPETEDEAGTTDLYAFDENQNTASNESSDRRLWRIAEFSLVVLLGLLITAMIMLPRLGRGSAGAGGE